MKPYILTVCLSLLFNISIAQTSLPLVPQNTLPIELPTDKILDNIPNQSKTISLDDLKKMKKEDIKKLVDENKKINNIDQNEKKEINTNTLTPAKPSADGYKLPTLLPDNNYTKESLTFDRLERTYLINKIGKRSENNDKKEPLNENNDKTESTNENTETENNENIKYPAILLLHAGTQTSEQVWNQTTLPKFTNENKYVLVAPQAYNGIWNDGSVYPLIGNSRSTVDDVGFLMTLIDKIVKNNAVDPKKIFIVGISNGGFMAIHFACRAGDQLRAGANLLSTMNYRDSINCNAKNVAWLSMNSGNDNYIPYTGQKNGRDRKGNTQEILLSAEETFSFFNTMNRCRQQGSYKQLPHFSDKDNTSAFIKIANSCSSNTSNVLLAFRNAGHQLPNVKQNFGFPYEGLSNQDIDPGTAIIHFFNNTLNPKLN